MKTWLDYLRWSHIIILNDFSLCKSNKSRLGFTLKLIELLLTICGRCRDIFATNIRRIRRGQLPRVSRAFFRSSTRHNDRMSPKADLDPDEANLTTQKCQTIHFFAESANVEYQSAVISNIICIANVFFINKSYIISWNLIFNLSMFENLCKNVPYHMKY